MFTRALVFTRTKHGADRVVQQLKRSGIRADAIHGNKSQNARQRTLADFKENRTSVLVATDIAARGHRRGRDFARPELRPAARAGDLRPPHRPHGPRRGLGIAVSFCDEEERDQLRAIERLIRRTLARRECPARREPARTVGNSFAGRPSASFWQAIRRPKTGLETQQFLEAGRSSPRGSRWPPPKQGRTPGCRGTIPASALVVGLAWPNGIMSAGRPRNVNHASRLEV